MTHVLKKLTDKTFSKLLKEDVVFPSQYFTTFNEYSKDFDINESNDITDNINDFLQNEVKKINTLSKQTLSNMEEFVECTNQATDAIQNKDENALKLLNQKVKSLQDNLSSLINEIYVDELTKLHNKKWLYNKLLNDTDKFQTNGTLIYIQIDELEYIKREYSEIIANNVIKFITNLINKQLEQNNFRYDFIRYLDDIFIINCSGKIEEIQSKINDIQTHISSSTLKTKSGILLKTNFHFSIGEYNEKSDFYELIETLHDKIMESNL